MSRMRCVFDTNVRFSAAISGTGTSARCLAFCQSNHQLLISEALLDEFNGVLLRKQRHTPQHISQVLGAVRASSEWITPRHTLTDVCCDPDDHRVLECALEGGASFIVSGDKDLLVLKQFREIRISSPAEALR